MVYVKCGTVMNKLAMWSTANYEWKNFTYYKIDHSKNINNNAGFDRSALLGVPRIFCIWFRKTNTK